MPKKPWKQLTKAERSQRISEGRLMAQARRQQERLGGIEISLDEVKAHHEAFVIKHIVRQTDDLSPEGRIQLINEITKPKAGAA